MLKQTLRVFVPLCAVTFLLLGSYAPVAGATDKPNIVLLFIDDLAWNVSFAVCARTIVAEFPAGGLRDGCLDQRRFRGCGVTR